MYPIELYFVSKDACPLTVRVFENEIYDVDFYVMYTVVIFLVEVICYVTTLFVVYRIEVFSDSIFDSSFGLSDIFQVAPFALDAIYHV